MVNDEIKDDIIDLYKRLMVAQKELNGGYLCSGGNMGKIISSYTLAKYGKNIVVEIKDGEINEIKKV